MIYRTHIRSLEAEFFPFLQGKTILQKVSAGTGSISFQTADTVFQLLSVQCSGHDPGQTALPVSAKCRPGQQVSARRIEDVDLQTEFEDAVYTYQELFRQDGIRLEYDDDGELYTDPIPGDPERLKQVLCNVLDNAAKHGGSGKRIIASLRREADSYVIRIRDFGPGIPPAELPYVKQKFYKGSSKARGSGIGLAVCDEIITRHGGTFEIGNADGGGALVTITLPIPPHTEHR